MTEWQTSRNRTINPHSLIMTKLRRQLSGWHTPDTGGFPVIYLERLNSLTSFRKTCAIHNIIYCDSIRIHPNLCRRLAQDGGMSFDALLLFCYRNHQVGTIGVKKSNGSTMRAVCTCRGYFARLSARNCYRRQGYRV